MCVFQGIGYLLLVLLCVAPAIAQSNANPVGAVTSALRGRDFEKALQLLQPALQQSPRSAQLWTLQGIAYAGAGKENDALASYQSALKFSPDYLPALEGAAQLEYNAGNKAAVPLLQHVLRLQPKDQTSHAMLGALAAKDGDCVQATEHFSQSGGLLESQPGALQQYGGCLVKLKQTDKALAQFRRALELNPSDPRARFQLAAVQLVAEQPEDAIETLTPLFKTLNADARTLQLASSAYEATGNTPQAVSTLRQAIVNDPRNVDLYLDFTSLSMDHQSFQAGIDMINAGLKLQPDAAPLYLARGVLHVQLAQFDEAEADFEKANTLDPAASLGSAAQGLEAVQRSDPDRALSTVRAKLAKNPNDPFLLYLQADILSQKGPDPGTADFRAAINSARKALAIQPTLTAARNVLAKLYLQSGDNQAAIEQSRKALNSDPRDQSALYHLIQALRKTGAKDELPTLLKQLAELRADSTRREKERNRYKLIVDTPSPTSATRP